MAGDRIEGGVLEGEGLSIALAPVELGPDPAGDGEHRIVEIETGDTALRTHEIRALACHDTGSAGDIEDPVAA